MWIYVRRQNKFAPEINFLFTFRQIGFNLSDCPIFKETNKGCNILNQIKNSVGS